MSAPTVNAGSQANEEIVVTPKAIEHLRRLMAENNVPAAHGLRVGVKGGGCSGLSYVLAFDEKPRDGDTVMEAGGISVFVDPKSLFYLSGTVLDYSDGLTGRGFMFTNPQAAKACGCGSSFGV